MTTAPAPDAHREAAPLVLVTWPDFERADAHAALTAAGLSVALAPKHGARSPAEVRALAGTASAAIVSTDPFDASVLARCAQLRVIARVGVGYDSIDVEAATQQGIAVTITPGANEATVADHTVALMLAAVRRIVEHDAAIRRGEWNRTGPHTPGQLAGSTVGLVGYGRIGRLVADRLRGFGVRLLVNDPVTPPAPTVEAVTLDALLAASDVVSVHVPLTAETRGLIAAPQLARMREGAVLVNTSRGAVIHEPALVDALRTGRIAAASLDVFADEPPQDPALLSLPNLTLSPHNAGLSRLSIDEMLRRAADSVIDVLHDRVPEDLANPEVLRHPAFAAQMATESAR